MQITVNGSDQDVRDEITVADLVVHLELPDRGVAVALDGAVVPKARWHQTTLRAQADVEILTAVQGG